MMQFIGRAGAVVWRGTRWREGAHSPVRVFALGMCAHIKSKVVWRVGEVRKTGIHGVIAWATGLHDGSGEWRRHARWVVMVFW